jgi:hypothetical protein
LSVRKKKSEKEKKERERKKQFQKQGKENRKPPVCFSLIHSQDRPETPASSVFTHQTASIID